MKSKKRVDCPVCGESFHLDSWLKIGQQVLCPECEETLEVVSLKPITLDSVFSMETEDLEGQDWMAGDSNKRIFKSS